MHSEVARALLLGVLPARACPQPPLTPGPAGAIACRERWQPSPASSHIPLTAGDGVLVTIYLLGREGGRTLSGD